MADSSTMGPECVAKGRRGKEGVIDRNGGKGKGKFQH